MSTLSILHSVLSVPFVSCPGEYIINFDWKLTLTSPIGIRLVTQEATIGGKTLKPGRKLLMPYKQLHFDSGVFGDNVNQFDPRRFLNDKNLLRSTSWRPFGGASTHCPGRFLARREVYMFVAIVLFRFDIKVVPAPREETPRFPRVDEAIPAGGLLPPVAGDDVLVEVRCARV
jgi:cytochrome P450